MYRIYHQMCRYHTYKDKERDQRREMDYKIFTVNEARVTPGARVLNHSLKGAGIEIPAIIVGEEGRGRELGVLPVGGISLKVDGSYDPILFAEVGQTKAGKPKLWAKSDATSGDFAVVVLPTKIGFRGGNSHTGDRGEPNYKLNFGTLGYEAQQVIKGKITDHPVEGWKEDFYYGVFPSSMRDKLLEQGFQDVDFEEVLNFLPFPGRILTKGTIAEGTAGRVGSGDQMVALIPKYAVFRTAYSGRLYGGPAAHYYRFDGEKILAATWDERILSDVF
ncbi:MAG: hypothetical protein WCJ70_04775 [bacterium]